MATSILVVSVSKYLNGNPIAKGITADWSKAKAHSVASSFENVGFDLNPNDVAATLRDLRNILEERLWDGVILGWCVRGHVEFTVLFEKLIELCFDVKLRTPRMKIMFSTGPDNLVETALRNFPVEEKY